MSEPDFSKLARAILSVHGTAHAPETYKQIEELAKSTYERGRAAGAAETREHCFKTALQWAYPSLYGEERDWHETARDTATDIAEAIAYPPGATYEEKVAILERIMPVLDHPYEEAKADRDGVDPPPRPRVLLSDTLSSPPPSPAALGTPGHERHEHREAEAVAEQGVSSVGPVREPQPGPGAEGAGLDIGADAEGGETAYWDAVKEVAARVEERPSWQKGAIDRPANVDRRQETLDLLASLSPAPGGMLAVSGDWPPFDNTVVAPFTIPALPIDPEADKLVDGLLAKARPKLFKPSQPIPHSPEDIDRVGKEGREISKELDKRIRRMRGAGVVETTPVVAPKATEKDAERSEVRALGPVDGVPDTPLTEEDLAMMESDIPIGYVRHLVREVRRLRETETKLRAEIALHDDKNGSVFWEVEKERDEALAELAKLQEQVRHLHEVSVDNETYLEQQRDEARAEVESTRSLAREWERLRNDAYNMARKYGEERDEARAELQVARADFQNMEARRDLMESALNEARAALADVRKQCDDMIAANDEMHAECERLRADLAQAVDEIRQIAERCETNQEHLAASDLFAFLARMKERGL